MSIPLSLASARAEGNNGWLGIGAMYIEAINQEQLANRDENGVILGNNEDTSFVPLPMDEVAALDNLQQNPGW